MKDPLFGKYCYINTPWIAGEKTIYRIVRSGVRSNGWREVPVKGQGEVVIHDWSEDVVFVVLDTLIDETSKIEKFALKDIELIGEPSDSEKPNSCETCKNWDIVNDHCYFIQECRYEPKDEPQTCANGCRWLNQDGECTEPSGECHIEYRTEVDEPQTDEEYINNLPWTEAGNGEQTDIEIARAIVHKAIDDAAIAEDAYPDLRQKMHDAVDNYEPQTERSSE